MVKASFDWDDVGSWLSLERVLKGDNQGNHHSGKAVYHFNAKGNISSTKRISYLLGVEDLIVVEEDDVLFISSKTGIKDIKLYYLT